MKKFSSCGVKHFRSDVTKWDRFTSSPRIRDVSGGVPIIRYLCSSEWWSSPSSAWCARLSHSANVWDTILVGLFQSG